MWPFTRRCKHNKLSQGAAAAYRCDRQLNHLGAHTCTISVGSGGLNAFGEFRLHHLEVRKWWTCIGCGLAADTNERLCGDCKKEDK